MDAAKTHAIKTLEAGLRLRNPNLHDSLFQFAKEATTLATKKQQPGVFPIGIRKEDWVQVSGQPNTFQKQETGKVHYNLTFQQLRKELIVLESFQRATTAIKSDPIWGPHMDTLVGSIKGSTRIDPYGVLIGIVSMAAKEADSLNPAASYLESAIAIVEEQFRSTEIEYVQITPLRGLMLKEKVALDSKLSIEPIEGEQVIELLRCGAIQPNHFGLFDAFIHDAPSAALIHRLSLEKRIGELGNDEAQKNAMVALTEKTTQMAADEMRVVDLLSLILDAHIFPLGVLTKSDGLASGSYTVQRSNYPDRLHVQETPLQAGQVNQLQTYWGFLSLGPKRGGALEIAVRRFSHAMSRTFKDDQLIDLMICAESLYFNNDSEQSELSHRLSYRAALLLGTTPSERRAIFDFMKDAYAQRSKVVHGKAHMARPKDAAALDALIRQLSIYLRQTILKLMDASCANGGRNAAIDWTDLMFGQAS